MNKFIFSIARLERKLTDSWITLEFDSPGTIEEIEMYVKEFLPGWSVVCCSKERDEEELNYMEEWESE